jgi:hypothetical protein
VQEALEADLTELHRRKAMLRVEWAMAINLTRAIVAAINHEAPPRPAFARANQNVAAAVTLLDTLLAPSTDWVDRVYHPLKDILGVAAKQQVESSLQWWVEVSVSSPCHSKASW